MFERHKALRYPIDSRQSLWRYLSNERLIDLLKTEELFFTHLPVFSDEFEGSLTVRTRENLAAWFQAQNQCDDITAWEEVKKYEKNQSEFFASCWHMNQNESYLMWKAYGDKGIAIRTNFERVQASFEEFTGAVTGGVINYVDFKRERTNVGNVFNLVMTKDLPYCDEREFRLLLWKIDQRNADLAQQDKGICVKVNVRMLIEKVFINPFNTSISSELMELLERKKIAIDQSALKDRKKVSALRDSV
jgi:hypothetical protein